MLLFLVFGIALGYLLSQPIRLRGVLDGVISPPLVFPPIAIGFFLLMAFGRHGIIGGWLHQTPDWDLVFSFQALVLASFVAGLPLALEPIQSAIEGSARDLIEAARSPGAGLLEPHLPAAQTGAPLMPDLQANLGFRSTGFSLDLDLTVPADGITALLGHSGCGKKTLLRLLARLKTPRLSRTRHGDAELARLLGWPSTLSARTWDRDAARDAWGKVAAGIAPLLRHPEVVAILPDGPTPTTGQGLPVEVARVTDMGSDHALSYRLAIPPECVIPLRERTVTPNLTNPNPRQA
nr:ATP-binding cassette domain-containing protein [Thiorhodococcus minor]